MAVIRGSLEWHRYHDKAVETVGAVVQRIHAQRTDSYGETFHAYCLVILFRAKRADTETWLKVMVDEEYHDSMFEGTQLAVHYLPDNPKVAFLEGEDDLNDLKRA